LRRGTIVLLLACVILALPARASAHARSATVALDYKLVLDQRTLPGVAVSILDGDRSLRVSAPQRTVVVAGDLGEPMLRIGPNGVWTNRASPTAVAEKLTTPGSGWTRLAAGSSYTWHEHRLAPPPWQQTTGAVARFDIPVTVDGSTTRIAGTFVRYARPALWPWLLGAVALAAIVGVALRFHRPVTTILGALAGFAAVVSLVAFAIADAPNGRVAWVQIVLGVGLAVAMYALLVRSHGARRSAVAGLLGGAAAAVSLGSLGVFRHGVVVSALPGTASRALVELAFVCGVAAAVTSLRREGLR
jgi:hypothetical protein